jgi:hypothetical protein
LDFLLLFFTISEEKKKTKREKENKKRERKGKERNPSSLLPNF